MALSLQAEVTGKVIQGRGKGFVFRLKYEVLIWDLGRKPPTPMSDSSLPHCSEFRCPRSVQDQAQGEPPAAEMCIQDSMPCLIQQRPWSKAPNKMFSKGA